MGLRIRAALLLAALGLGSSACSLSSDGFFRHPDNSPVRYEIVADQHAYVYRAAYEVCRREHRAGYIVLRQPLPHDDWKFLGRFQCAGEYDPTLALRYEYMDTDFVFGNDPMTGRHYFRFPRRKTSRNPRDKIRMNTLNDEPVEKFMGQGNY